MLAKLDPVSVWFQASVFGRCYKDGQTICSEFIIIGKNKSVGTIGNELKVFCMSPKAQ